LKIEESWRLARRNFLRESQNQAGNADLVVTQILCESDAVPKEPSNERLALIRRPG